MLYKIHLFYYINIFYKTYDDISHGKNYKYGSSRMCRT